MIPDCLLPIGPNLYRCGRHGFTIVAAGPVHCDCSIPEAGGGGAPGPSPGNLVPTVTIREELERLISDGRNSRPAEEIWAGLAKCQTNRCGLYVKGGGCAKTSHTCKQRSVLVAFLAAGMSDCDWWATLAEPGS